MKWFDKKTVLLEQRVGQGVLLQINSISITNKGSQDRNACVLKKMVLYVP